MTLNCSFKLKVDMTAFKGKLPPPKLKPLNNPPELQPKPIDETPPKVTDNLSAELSVEAKLRFEIANLKTKIEILELHIAGLKMNDNEYIRKLKEALASEKRINHSLTLQIADSYKPSPKP